MKYVLIPFAWLLRMLYSIFDNYGIALILFSLITKLILLPLTAKSKKSMMKTSRLGPKLKELQARCGDDKLKYQQEMSNLYKKEGVSPTGGCLWSLLPMILLLLLYYIIRQPLTHLMHLTADQIVQITNLISGLGYDVSSGNAAYSEIYVARYIHENIAAVREIVPNIFDIDFSFLGVSLGQIPSWKFWFSGDINRYNVLLFVFPCVSALSQWASMMLSQKLNGSIATNEKGEKDQDAAAAAAQSMKTMMYIMPIFSLWIGFSMPAAMSIYWIAQAVFTTGIDALLTLHYRKIYDAEDAIKREKAAEEAAIEAEKEARRAERRAMQSESGANPNTSRRKVKKQIQQQKAINDDFKGKGKLTEEEREEILAQREEKAKAKGLSGDPNRPYCRGRAYDPNRYGKNRHTEEVAESQTEEQPESTENTDSE